MRATIERERVHLDIPNYMERHSGDILMTYADLARHTRIPQATAYRYVYDLLEKVDMNKLGEICDVLECDPGDLLITHDEWVDRKRRLEGE